MTFANLRSEDIVLAIRMTRLLDALGVWDQVPFRQLVVERYSPMQDFIRPFYNAWAQLRGGPLFSCGWPAEPAFDGGSSRWRDQSDNRSLIAMIDHVRRRRIGPGMKFDVWGLRTGFAASLIESESVFTYVTRVYLVSWDDDAARLERLRSQNLYLELGCL